MMVWLRLEPLFFFFPNKRDGKGRVGADRSTRLEADGERLRVAERIVGQGKAGRPAHEEGWAGRGRAEQSGANIR